MPNITVVRDHLFEAIGRSFTDHEFDELCFEFGVEVDDVCTETVEFTADGSKEEHVVYVIAIPANRYDLLCLEGFARALRIFLGLASAPVYSAVAPTQPELRITVAPSTRAVRPYIVFAVLRDVCFDKKNYKSFIDLQEKLHQNICRKRSYVAIGTHDLDAVKGPFRYEALPPEQINFVPLTEEDGGRSFSGKELLDFYREDPTCKHLKPYTDLIYDSPVYPVVLDAQNKVLSLPPIINSRASRITLHTRNVLIECTATDLTKAHIVLDTVVAMFSHYCAQPFTAEKVEIVGLPPTHTSTESATPVSVSEEVLVTPLLSHRRCETKLSEIRSVLGLDAETLTGERAVSLCEKMQLGPAVYDAAAETVSVTVPPTRSDVLHPVDVIEDVGIAYGYNNLALSLPKTVTSGAALPINSFTDLLRQEIARAGYMEMLTHGLCSTAENFTHLMRPVGPAVALSNPANVEYEVVRTTLLPGALKTLSYNKSMSHKEGVKLFEISDVVLPCENDVGARNERHLVALYSAYSASLEIIHGLADKVMTAVQIPPEKSYGAMSLTADELADRQRVARPGVVYTVRATEQAPFFPGMGAEIVLLRENAQGESVEEVVGVLGVVHPTVLQNFEVSYPCSVVEMNLEKLM